MEIPNHLISSRKNLSPMKSPPVNKQAAGAVAEVIAEETCKTVNLTDDSPKKQLSQVRQQSNVHIEIVQSKTMSKQEQQMNMNIVVMQSKESKHTCNVCDKTFTHAEGLKRHIRTHTGEKRVYSCEHCEYSSTRRNHLNKHIMRKHPGEMVLCKTKSATKCNICDRTFTRAEGLKRHMRTHTGERPYVCPYCNKAFAVKANLTTHTRMHSKHEQQMNINEVVIQSIQSNIIEAKHMCNVCDKTFTHAEGLKQHLRTHTGENSYGGSSTTPTHTHSGKRLYSCEHCEYSSTRRNNLNKHIMRKHPGEVVLSKTKSEPICNICDKTFTRADGLKRHMRTHTGEKPYVCPYCNKGFAVKVNLTTHTRIHSGERPYSCEHCKYSSIRKIDLIRHMSTHKDEEQYLCDLCEYTCKTKCNLRYHMRTHREERFKCELCNSNFRLHSHLKKHVCLHAAVKLFTCDTCGKSFTNDNNLKCHNFTCLYSGEKPFKCSICSETFTNQTMLTSHAKHCSTTSQEKEDNELIDIIESDALATWNIGCFDWYEEDSSPSVL